MSKAQKTHQMSPDGETTWERKVVKISLSFTEKDSELLDALADFFGSSRSDAARTAIRLTAAQMLNPLKVGATIP